MLWRLFIFIFLTFSAYSGEHFLSFQNYLDGETSTEKSLNDLKRSYGETLVIKLNSSSGDLNSAINYARTIKGLKETQGLKVIVYIEERAVGPAAIFPFLADELFASEITAWGDIPYGTSTHYSTVQLRQIVKEFIPEKSPTLDKLADAMIDPLYQIARQDGEVILSEEEGKKKFGPLILNTEQMESFHLLDEVISPIAFKNRYDLNPFKGINGTVLHGDFDKYLKIKSQGPNLIGYLSIEKDRPIDQSTYIYIQFALKSFIKKEVDFIVFRLNTPGGEVLSSVKIASLLQKIDVEKQIPVIAFIDDWAISAGAMLAYSCRFIGIVKTSIMGAAEPVLMGKEGKMESASEKVNSALRAEFSNLASFYGRNSLIAEAMVDKDLLLVMRKGEVVKLRNEDEIIKGGSDPDQIITEQGKLLTLDAKQLIKYNVADFEVPIVPLTPITKKEKAEGEFPASKSLLFQETYLKNIPNAMLLTYEDWRVTFFSILSHPVVASLLFMGLIIGFYIEINSPGFGFPGSIALTCLVLILLSSFAIHAINWIEIILLLAGIVLLAVELFVIPGFGIIGILGIILTVIGLFALMLPGLENFDLFDAESFSLIANSVLTRLAYLCGALILSVILIVLFARFFSHRFYTLSKLVLKGEETGNIATIPEEDLPRLGEQGESYTPLRPSGKVQINENIFDAVTLGGFIEKGAKIKIIRIEGSKLIVKKLEK